MLEPPLTDVEVRILGALVEKEATTPDNYPLSINALAAACNQTTNRDPIMRLEEPAILEAIVPIRRRGLMRSIQPAGSRVTKYEHAMGRTLDLDESELGLLCVLMLRGAQTVAELQTRSARLANFAGPDDVERTLELLALRAAGPLVTRLERRPGQKEARWAHLLSGEPVVTDAPAPSASHADDRVATLERTVADLRAELDALRGEFEQFRAQF